MNGHGRPIDILLVEDDPGDVELTREALRLSKLALRLHVVDDGEKALRFLRREPPYEQEAPTDLILLDLNLPRLDGRDVLRALKADSRLRPTPVVILTTSQAETDVLMSYDLGANCYVTKPLGLDQFLHVVRSIESFWLTIVKLPVRKEGPHARP